MVILDLSIMLDLAPVNRLELIAILTPNWYLGYIKNIHKPENEVIVCHEAEQPDFPSMMFAGNFFETVYFISYL